jgi:inosine-uridine nucleoside N-ribohydrolase
VKTEEMKIYVETEGKVTSGMTMPFRHPKKIKDPPNCQVCIQVEADKFLNFFLEKMMTPKGDEWSEKNQSRREV